MTRPSRLSNSQIALGPGADWHSSRVSTPTGATRTCGTSSQSSSASSTPEKPECATARDIPSPGSSGPYAPLQHGVHLPSNMLPSTEDERDYAAASSGSSTTSSSSRNTSTAGEWARGGPAGTRASEHGAKPCGSGTKDVLEPAVDLYTTRSQLALPAMLRGSNLSSRIMPEVFEIGKDVAALAACQSNRSSTASVLPDRRSTGAVLCATSSGEARGSSISLQESAPGRSGLLQAGGSGQRCQQLQEESTPAGGECNLSAEGGAGGGDGSSQGVGGGNDTGSGDACSRGSSGEGSQQAGGSRKSGGDEGGNEDEKQHNRGRKKVIYASTQEQEKAKAAAEEKAAGTKTSQKPNCKCNWL